MTDTGSLHVQNFLEFFFEQICRNDLNPLDRAIHDSHVLSEFRGAMYKTQKLGSSESSREEVENIRPNEVVVQSSPRKNPVDDIERTIREFSTQLEEYHRVALQPVNIHNDLNEISSEYTSACTQLKRQIAVADEQRLDSALRAFTALDSDEIRGGYARLHGLIEVGVASIEDSIELLSSRISASRKEFVAIRHSEELLECCAQSSYERVRDSYNSLLRACRKRSCDNDLQWTKLEAECREWMLNEMKSTLDKYEHRSGSSYGFAMTDREPTPMEKSRISTSRRFQKFSDHFISTTEQREKDSLGYLTALRGARAASMRYKVRQCMEMEDWLDRISREIDECYMESIEDIQNRVSSLRLEITQLELHQKKLAHLLKLSVVGKISGKQTGQKQSPKESVRMTPVRGQQPFMDSCQKSYFTSMNLGSRIRVLCGQVGVTDDECAVLLTQLLHTVNPDVDVMNKLGQHVNQYSKRMTSRIA